MSDVRSVAPELTVLVLAGDRRRAVVPTLRSVRSAASRLPVAVDLVVVADPERVDEIRAIVSEADSAAVVTTAGSGRLGDVVRTTRSPVIALLDAGDLVGTPWLVEGMRVAGQRRVLLHPESVLVFGEHTGWWRQPGPGARGLLPVAVTWASPVIAARDLAQLLIDTAGAQPRQYVAASSQLVHDIVPGTVCFVRSWDTAPPWSVPLGELLAPDVSLRTSSAVAELVMRRKPPARIVAASRIARQVARPWIDGVRARRRRRRGLAAFPGPVIDQWRAANAVEPLVPFPRGEFNVWHRTWPGRDAPEAQWADAYARLVARLPPRIDYLFFVPWLRMGGGDAVAASYVNAVRRLDPRAEVVLITTEPVESTMLGALDEGVTAVELRDVTELDVHRTAIVERVLPQLIAQYRPTTIHAFNSTVAFDIVERFGDLLSQDAAIFLSSFAIDRDADGERLSVMFLRRPGFLDPVSRVLVDSRHYVEAMVSDYGYDRDRFAIQSHVVEVSRMIRSERPPFSLENPLRLLWAGRFDLPKRLDILADVAEALRAEGLPVEIEFYGSEVMGHPGLVEVLRRLAAAGAVRHPPYAGFGSLPLDRFDAYVMTSEWEGVPHTVLEAMAAGLPVIAPLVGGVGEVLDETTGYPVARFDDVSCYVTALRVMISDFPDARARAVRARSVIEREYSEDRFERFLQDLPGYLRTRR